eukprot:6015304-Pleurochrysis_carterae.AAC.1
MWPVPSICDLETWREAVKIHNDKINNRVAKRKALAAKAADNDVDALFALRRVKKLAPLNFRETLLAHYRDVLHNHEVARARARPRPDFKPNKLSDLIARANHDGFARYRDAARSPG